MPTLDLVLTNTHVPRSTMALVGKVKAMNDDLPAVVNCLLEGMGAIASQFRELKDIREKGDILMTLVRTNQFLLRAVGVSHPSLDRICEVVDNVAQGDAATKLTGAGGGGCAMTILKPGCDLDLSTRIQAALEAPVHRPWHFTCLRSCVGREGVLWIDPSFFPKARPKVKENPWIGRVFLCSLTVAAVGVSVLFSRTKDGKRFSVT